MKVQAYYPVTITVDGEEIALRIKRMSMEEHSEFSIRFAKVGIPTYMRFVSRRNSGAEQERDDKGEYMIPFEKIAENRLNEMSTEKRAEYQAAAESDEAEAKKFLTYACEQFVTVERGLIEESADGTEQSVTEGLDLLRIFGARRDVIQRILEAVRCENELDVDQKKAWRSPADSSLSSTAPHLDQAGQKPETTAPPAETEDSAGNGDAIPVRNGSGSMEQLPLSPARSLD